MTETAFDINKYDFDAVERELAGKKKPGKSFSIDAYDFDKVEREIKAGKETEQRGTIGDIISAPVRGVTIEMPELFLDTAAATERIARKTFGAEKETGFIGDIAKAGKEKLEEFRAEHPILRAKEKPGIIEQGIESAALSISSGAPGALAGFGIGSLFGPASPITAPMGALIGFAFSGGLTFGLAEYENVIQMADEQGIDRAESEPAAIWSGLAEGGFEFASDLLTGGILKVAKPLTMPAEEGLKTGIRQLFKMGFKEAMARTGAVLASETSMEMLTAGVQAEQYRKIGLGDSTFWEGAKEAMGPAFVASVIFAGVGTGAMRLHQSSIRRSIENGAIDPKKRMQAANEVGEVLNHIDKDIAKVWRTNAAEAIKNKENIDIDDPDLIRNLAAERAQKENNVTPENIAAKEQEIKQEIQEEKQDDIRNHISLATAIGEINDRQAHELGRNIGLSLEDVNQALIRGADVQRMFNDADPIELRPFAVRNDIPIPDSITNGNQMATIIQEGLKEEGSVVSELAKQVKNLEKTAATRGMEHTAKNLERKKAALDEMLSEPEEVYGEAPPIEKGFEKEVISDREKGKPLVGEVGEGEEPGGTVPEPETGGEKVETGGALQTQEEVTPEKAPWSMTVDEFEKFAEGGKIQKATGEELPGEAEAKTPIALGEINKYSEQDIAHFYLAKHTPKEGERTPEMTKAAYEELLSDAALEGKPVLTESTAEDKAMSAMLKPGTGEFLRKNGLLGKAEGAKGEKVEGVEGEQVFTGKTSLSGDKYGASIGNLSEGNKRQLMVDEQGDYFWGNYKETYNLETGAIEPEGEHSNYRPALFDNAKDARIAGEKTPQSEQKPTPKPKGKEAWDRATPQERWREPVWNEEQRPSDKNILGARKTVQAEKSERQKIIEETGLPQGYPYTLIEKMADTSTTKELKSTAGKPPPSPEKADVALTGEGGEYVGREWESKEGKRKVVGINANGKLEVSTEGSKFPQLLDSSELETTIEFDKKNLKFRKKEDAKLAEKKAASEKIKAEQQDTDGFADQFDEMKRGKIVKILQKQQGISGKFASRKTHIRNLIAEGWKVRQDKGKRIFESTEGSFLIESDITKTGMDYAEYLSKKSIDNPPQESIGTAWIKNAKKPIIAAREIKSGKFKGKVEVTLTAGRDAQGNVKPGKKVKVDRKSVVEWPGEVEKAKPKPEGKEEPLYSTTEPKAKTTADQVLDIVLPHIQGMTQFPTVRVVQSIKDLPKRLKDNVTAFSKKSNKQVEGFYDKVDDQVFLIADNLSEGRIEAVLRHEAEGHRGIRLLLGTELDGFLDGVGKVKKDELKRHDPNLNFKDQEAVRVAADEWCARKIEAGNLGKKFWDDLVRVFRKWLRKFVPNLDLSNGEIRSVLTDTVKNVRTGRIDRMREAQGMPLYSTTPDEEIANLEQEIKSLREEFKEKIKTTSIKETVLEKTGKLRLSDIVKETRITTRETYQGIERKKKGIALLKEKQKRKESLENARLKKQARDRVNKIIKGWKKIDTKKMSPPQAAAINNLLDDIDLTKLSSGKQLRLEKTRQYLDNNPDTEMPDSVLKDLERLEKTAARDLTLDDLESLNIAVLHHAHLDKVKQKIRVGRQDRQRQNVLNDAMGEMKTPKKVRSEIISSQQGSFGKIKKTGRLIADTFGIRHDHFDLIVESLAGQNSIMDKVLYQNVKEGITEELKYKQQTFRKFQEDLGDFDKKHGIKDLTKWISETVKTDRLELTRGERMSLYRHSLNADNKRAIIQGGFGFKFSDEPNRVHHVTKDEFNSVIDSITDAEKDFAGAPVDNLFTDQIERLDAVFMQKNGYALPREENYHPKDTMPLARGKDLESEEALELFKGKWLRIGVSKGMLEKRKRVQLPIYLNSITYDINTSVSKSAAYIGLELPLSNASKLLYNSDFRLNLTNRYGEQVWKEIEKGLRDIAGEHRTYTTTEKLLIKAKNKLSTAMLGLNPFVISKQILSLPVYLPYVKSKYLAFGVIDNIWHPKEITGRHKMYSPEYLERIEGGYSRDVADVFKAGAEKRVYGGRKSIKEKFMSGIKLFDQAAVNMGMHGAVLQTLDEFKAGKLSREVQIALDMKDSDIAGLSPEKKMQLAYKFADYATQRTQPMFSPEHRSSLSRGSTIEQLATMFGSFTNQALNLTRRSYREAVRTGDKQAYAKFSKSLMVIFVINTMGVMAIDDIRDRLYGREEKSFVNRILSSWSSYMFFVRDLAASVISKVERGTFLGYDVSLPVGRIPELLSNAIANGVTTLTEKDIKKRKKAASNFIDDSLELTTMISGLPYATPKKLAGRVLFGAPTTKDKEVKTSEKGAKHIKVIRKNYKELLKENPDKAVKYFAKHKNEIRMWRYAQNLTSRISRMQKRIDTIMDSKKFSPEAKRRKVEILQAAMVRMAQRFNKMYEGLK